MLWVSAKLNWRWVASFDLSAIDWLFPYGVRTITNHFGKWLIIEWSTEESASTPKMTSSSLSLVGARWKIYLMNIYWKSSSTQHPYFYGRYKQLGFSFELFLLCHYASGWLNPFLVDFSKKKRVHCIGLFCT